MASIESGSNNMVFPIASRSDGDTWRRPTLVAVSARTAGATSPVV
ncbi:MAG TPA: hypothetical protein P5159_26100 [Phycisphaerae bacterium]|nr:hypothetical protein [Phycisphaerae bacterium]